MDTSGILTSLREDLKMSYTYLSQAQERLDKAFQRAITADASLGGIGGGEGDPPSTTEVVESEGSFRNITPEEMHYHKFDLNFSPTERATYMVLQMPPKVRDQYKIRLIIDTSRPLRGVDEDDFLNLMWFGPEHPRKKGVIDWKKTYGYWLIRVDDPELEDEEFSSSLSRFISNVVRQDYRKVDDQEGWNTEKRLVLDVDFSSGMLRSKLIPTSGFLHDDYGWGLLQAEIDWPTADNLLAWFSMPDSHKEEPSIGWTYKTLEVWT